MNFVRHGDVLLRRVEIDLPEEKEAGTVVVAEGEVTNHHHRLTAGANGAVALQGFNGKRYARVMRSVATLSHEEHSALSIEPGTYEIGIEREYDYCENEMRKVVD